MDADGILCRAAGLRSDQMWSLDIVDARTEMAVDAGVNRALKVEFILHRHFRGLILKPMQKCSNFQQTDYSGPTGSKRVSGQLLVSVWLSMHDGVKGLGNTKCDCHMSDDFLST